MKNYLTTVISRAFPATPSIRPRFLSVFASPVAPQAGETPLSHSSLESATDSNEPSLSDSSRTNPRPILPKAPQLPSITSHHVATEPAIQESDIAPLQPESKQSIGQPESSSFVPDQPAKETATDDRRAPQPVTSATSSQIIPEPQQAQSMERTSLRVVPSPSSIAASTPPRNAANVTSNKNNAHATAPTGFAPTNPNAQVHEEPSHLNSIQEMRILVPDRNRSPHSARDRHAPMQMPVAAIAKPANADRPIVHVNIGKIEVRAVVPPPPRPESRPRPTRAPSLNQYLADRAKGASS